MLYNDGHDFIGGSRFNFKKLLKKEIEILKIDVQSEWAIITFLFLWIAGANIFILFFKWGEREKNSWIIIAAGR